MKYLVIIGIIVLIIYLVKKKPKMSVQTKAVIFLLICAAIFAIIGTFAFEKLCGVLWKSSLIISALVFLYSLFVKMFDKKDSSSEQLANQKESENDNKE